MIRLPSPVRWLRPARWALAVMAAVAASFAAAQTQPWPEDLRIGTEAWWAATDSRGVQRVHIQCGSNFIDPREIVVRSNVPVELSVRTTGGLPPHAFGSPGSRVLPVLPVQAVPTAFAFVPGEVGRFPIVCQPTPGPDADPVTRARKKGALIVLP